VAASASVISVMMVPGPGGAMSNQSNVGAGPYAVSASS